MARKAHKKPLRKANARRVKNGNIKTAQMIREYLLRQHRILRRRWPVRPCAGMKWSMLCGNRQKHSGKADV